MTSKFSSAHFRSEQRNSSSDAHSHQQRRRSRSRSPKRYNNNPDESTSQQWNDNARERNDWDRHRDYRPNNTFNRERDARNGRRSRSPRRDHSKQQDRDNHRDRPYDQRRSHGNQQSSPYNQKNNSIQPKQVHKAGQNGAATNASAKIPHPIAAQKVEQKIVEQEEEEEVDDEELDLLLMTPAERAEKQGKELQDKTRKLQQLLNQVPAQDNSNQSNSDEKYHNQADAPAAENFESTVSTVKVETINNGYNIAANSKSPNFQSILSASSNPPINLAEDDLDMFSDGPIPESAPSPINSTTNNMNDISVVEQQSTAISSHPSRMLDVWTDSEGYYKYRLGDIIIDPNNNRSYQVCGMQGSGAFSTVLRVKQSMDAAHSTLSPADYVIKVFRNREVMHKAGMKEVEMLTRLLATDPHNRSKHIIALISHFRHRGHLCLVFEAASLDLRKLIRNLGSVGLSISGVQLYVKQLFTALKHMKKHSIIHTDLKPDNILVYDNVNSIAICDFGSALSVETDRLDVTPVLGSRFYCAPEVMLGLAYSYPIDLWSIGCCLYELYTGKILFSGSSNNEMLYKQQEIRGKIPNKMIKKGQFAAEHFDLNDANTSFLLHKRDPHSEQILIERIPFTPRPNKEVFTMLKQHSNPNLLRNEAEMKKLRQLSDCIEACCTIDVSKRLTVEELLQHPFLTGQSKQQY
jgi:serine/threonine-protein kinase PRP4